MILVDLGIYIVDPVDAGTAFGNAIAPHLVRVAWGLALGSTA